MKELAMNWQFLSKIWRPDTYFLNGKDSYLHKIAVPNRSAMTSIQSRRLLKNFSFVYSSRPFHWTSVSR
jgi:hypothetical protein